MGVRLQFYSNSIKGLHLYRPSLRLCDANLPHSHLLLFKMFFAAFTAIVLGATGLMTPVVAVPAAVCSIRSL